ncbi:hypothetical protein [Schaalia dentiphila]|jgi:hypothetical protein|nr:MULTISPECIES: hypothetical protein [Schaalia]
MSERMRVIWAIGLIAAVGCGAFFGLRALAAGGQQTTMESGLSVPAQSDGAGPQSAPVVAATEEPTPTPEPAPEPTSEDPAPAPTPAPVATNPYYVAPTSPQRAVPDDDDDDDDDDHDDDTDD